MQNEKKKEKALKIILHLPYCHTFLNITLNKYMYFKQIMQMSFLDFLFHYIIIHMKICISVSAIILHISSDCVSHI